MNAPHFAPIRKIFNSWNNNRKKDENGGGSMPSGADRSASHPAEPANVVQPPAQPEVMFDSLGLHPDLLRGIHDLGFIRPTPIQAGAIPPVIQGRDVIGIAQTGTGKTAAFMLPILHKLMQVPSRGHVRALVIAPTRELAMQSMDHLRDLSRYVPIKGAAIFGGVPMEPQITALAKGIDIISATPGRLLDHIYSGRIDFVDLQIFVLDEVDRMLDMGFLPDVQRIIRLLPPQRQNLVFSATLPSEIQDLVHQILRDPVTIQIGRKSSTVSGVRQALYPVPRHRKPELLMELLRGQGMNSVLIFTRTKHYADKLTQVLTRNGFKVSVMHGDRSQSQRIRAIEQFRKGRTPILVATDIAARGIDIEDISHVINFDVPNSPEDYVHRIGRTARAEATGDAFTLVDPEEESMIADIERVVNKQLPRLTLPNFDYLVGGGHGSGARDRHGRRSGPDAERHGQPGSLSHRRRQRPPSRPRR